jgi:hypothetical protein
MEYIKPTTFNIVWASAGVSTAPSNTKYQTGWVPEKPSYQNFNYLLNKFDVMLNHVNQTGIVEWDSLTEYQANKSYIRLANKIYFCKQTHTNQNPSTDISETYWRPILDGTKLLPDASVSSFMKTVLNDPNGQEALTTMGVTSTGYNVVTATSQANARTAIGVVSASESSAGIIEIATASELNTGTDNTRAITPAKAKLGFAVSLGVNGYLKLPNWLGGLIIQWGRLLVAKDATSTWTYPIPFPTEPFVGFGTHAQSFDVLRDAGVGVYDMTTTTATISNGVGDTGGTSLINVLAIGY